MRTASLPFGCVLRSDPVTHVLARQRCRESQGNRSRWSQRFTGHPALLIELFRDQGRMTALQPGWKRAQDRSVVWNASREAHEPKPALHPPTRQRAAPEAKETQRERLRIARHRDVRLWRLRHRSQSQNIRTTVMPMRSYHEDFCVPHYRIIRASNP